MENTNNVYEGTKFSDIIPYEAEPVEETTEETSQPVSNVQEQEDDTYVNKCGIEEDIVKLFTVTEADVIKYIQNNIVGAPILCDFSVHPGTSINKYVVARVGIPAKYAATRVAAKIDNPHMQREHELKSSSIYMADPLYKRLEKFMFPKTPDDINSDQMKKEYYTKIGLTAQVYSANIAPYIEPQIVPVPSIGESFFVLVLQTDNIISEMLNEGVKSGKPYGELEILNIIGGDPIRDSYGTKIVGFTPITWKCTIDLRKKLNFAGKYNIGMNEIFNAAQ